MLTVRDLGPLRLAAQRVAGPSFATPGEAVRWLTAVQAQDYRGALTSVALRTQARSIADVERALSAGEIVRSWPMRGTLHFLAAEDLPWMLRVTAPRVVAAAATRRVQLELADRDLERGRELAVQALSGGARLRRDDLYAQWDGNGLATQGQRGYHLLSYLAQTGTLCLGPVDDGDQRFVLVDEWVPRPRQLSREEGLGELALRYFRGHGPATVKDFARWTNLVAADTRTGIAIARPDLDHVEVDGVEYLMDPGTPGRLDACRARAAGVFLLPGFDEFILGYANRATVLPAEFANLIVPGGNGVFRPTVVSGGQVVGTWKHNGKGVARTVAATPFEAFSGTVTAAIARAYADLP